MVSRKIFMNLGKRHKSNEGFIKKFHYVKSVQTRSFSGPYFPLFGLHTEIYEVLVILIISDNFNHKILC